jgi:hypothetical protein
MVKTRTEASKKKRRGSMTRHRRKYRRAKSPRLRGAWVRSRGSTREDPTRFETALRGRCLLHLLWNHGIAVKLLLTTAREGAVRG